ncbi:MAG: DMT family transporter [Fimbriimonadaceae bacterium]
MSKSALPYAAFFGCALVWSSTFLVIRIGNDSLPPLWACSLRLALAATILNLILVATRQPWPRGDALRAAAWYGFWEFGVSLTLLYWGERVVPSGLAAVIYALCPVVAIFEAKALKMESLNAKRLGVALLAFGGVAIIFWRELLHGGSTAGLVAILTAAGAAPIAGLMLQRGPTQGAVGANAVGVLVGFPMSLGLSFALREPHVLPRSTAQVFPVIYLAVAGSTGAFVLFAWLVHQWKTTTVAFLGVIVPVIAVVLGALFRHEAFARGSLIGAVVVVVGVIIALRSRGLANDVPLPGERQ